MTTQDAVTIESRPVGPGDDSGPERAENGAAELAGGLEPLSMSLMGRLFAVPLLIIGSIVGGAVVVVLLFAGPAAPKPRNVDDLLTALEMTSGDRSMGMLLPREQELWQAAQELSLRLTDRDPASELSLAKLGEVAARLAALVRNDLGRDPASASAPDFSQPGGGSARLEYMIRALARTAQPLAVDVLLEALQSGNDFYALLAMKELAELHDLPAAAKAVPPIVRVLESASADDTKLVAATALSVLAEPGDERVIDALAAARLASEGEVAWSAALALARLGSDRGKQTLLDLLDRPFLSSGMLFEVVDERGSVHRYRLPAQRVEQVLLAAIEAASHLGDDELWDAIEGLAASDPSPAVRGRAAAVLRDRI